MNNETLCFLYLLVASLSINDSLMADTDLIVPNPYQDWELVNGGELVVSSTEDDIRNKDFQFPSIIEVPDWVESKPDPSAKYYLYFGEHHGRHIRMKWAPSIEGPWTAYDSDASNARYGVMDFRSDSYRNADLGGKEDWIHRGHVASPDVMVDHENQVFIMNFHGAATRSGESITLRNGEKYTWRHSNFVAFSNDGLNFNDPQTGGGQPGTWGTANLPFGPLEQFLPNTSEGDLEVTTKIGGGYNRFIKIRGNLYVFSSGGNILRPKNSDNPWIFPESSQADDELFESQKNENALFRSGDEMIEFWKLNAEKTPDKRAPKYDGHITTWFASSSFRDHPNNPTKDLQGGPLTVPYKGSGTPKVNHVAVFPIDENHVEVFIYIRIDSVSYYRSKGFEIVEEDPFRNLSRVVLDVSDDNWDNWKVAEHNGAPIYDVILTPEEVYAAVKSANGGGDIDGFTHADPLSFGDPFIIQTSEGKYCFVCLKSEDANESDDGHSEGQIVAFKLNCVGVSTAGDFP